MTYLTSLQLVLLFFVTVHGSHVSNTSNKIQNKYDNIAEIEKVLKSESQNVTAKQADNALKDFLLLAMANYTTWLSEGDHLDPDPAETVLNINSGEILKAILSISNQYMIHPHSSKSIVPLVFSRTSEGFLSVMLIKPDNSDFNVSFGGNYSVNGSMYIEFNATTGLEIPFSGKGGFEFWGKYGAESVLYSSYSLDKNGYIDLSKALGSFVYTMSLQEYEFQGLQFDYEGEVEDFWMQVLQSRLSLFYWYYLEGMVFPDTFQEHNPPRRLLNMYLQEILSSKKFEDIVARTPENSNGGIIFTSGWLILLALAASCDLW